MSKKRIVIISILTLLLIAITVIYNVISSNLSKPSQGVVSPAKISSTKTASINLVPKSVAGQLASFSYPKILTVAANNKNIPPVVAQYNYIYHDIESWHLAIDITSIPSGNVNDNSAYQYRKINPSTYQESHILINNQSVIVMSDATVGGFNKVAFLVSPQYQATVSLYGDDPTGTDPLQATFNMVLDTWHWRS